MRNNPYANIIYKADMHDFNEAFDALERIHKRHSKDDHTHCCQNCPLVLEMGFCVYHSLEAAYEDVKKHKTTD